MSWSAIERNEAIAGMYSQERMSRVSEEVANGNLSMQDAMAYFERAYACRRGEMPPTRIIHEREGLLAFAETVSAITADFDNNVELPPINAPAPLNALTANLRQCGVCGQTHAGTCELDW